MRLLHAALLVTTVTSGSYFSCQTGDFVGPQPGTGSIDGTWNAGTVTVATTDPLVSCAANGMTFELAQNGATVYGNYSWTSMTCSGPGAPASSGSMSGSITNGTLVGTTVSFALGASGFEFAGTVSGNSMSGACTWQVWLAPPAGQTTLSGGWTAVRN